ncbi:hypothetical protein P280DRAFT_511716 [Massarina eburnea CBS 473.64]|uniref:3-carboxymuconate cyclase n=1 Tax=Massarina eburnea CBS 473.64 TaxID=1395130 RepID=A0A6A6RGX4_9PLEO|nr:hypothetical protein P280DRAFT_511716 [Massarina eburnea CBS 473.64]
MFSFANSSLFIILLTSLVSASPIVSPNSASTIQHRHSEVQKAASANGKAIYTITNAAENNAVVAVKIHANGTLGEASITDTGGNGSASVNVNGTRAMPDSLDSQSALTIAGHHIFAVNAGSNTISMLAILPHDPLRLQLIGKPVKLPGTFPNTVAASSENALVCVGTTGSKAGISCANFDAKNGIGAMDALRLFELGQSDPPVGPLNTVSQTFFSEDQNLLYTTVKGDPAANKTGFISVFAVDKGETESCASTLSKADTRSSPVGTAVLFGSQVIPSSKPPRIFTTDASFGAGILTLSPENSAALTANQTVADQRATCWSTISAFTNTAFVTDVAIDRILEISLTDATILASVDLRGLTPDPGLTDLGSAGRFVYALSPGNGTTEAAVSVVDVVSKKLVQRKGLGVVGVKGTAAGMAVLL